MSGNNERMAQTEKSAPEFTAEERAAARQRAKELKAQEAAAAALKSVIDKIASLDVPAWRGLGRSGGCYTGTNPPMPAETVP